MKRRTIFSIVLIVGIVALAIVLYTSIMRPVKFDAEYNSRSTEVINKLKDIRTIQEAFKSTNGRFCGDIDSLLVFLETGKVNMVKKFGVVPDSLTEAQAIKAGVVKVVVSMGDKGLLQITKTKVIKAVPPRIKKVNTVGCGDCVVAAMILGMLQGLNDEDTMKFAAGVSAANATTLESGMIPQDTMETLIQDVVIVTV